MITFEEKIAYEIGFRRAQAAYLEKEANWQAVKAFGSGLKGLATGSGKTVSEAFRTGASGKGFKQVASDFGKGMADPWRRAYGDFTRRGATKLKDTHRTNIQGKRDAQAAFDKLKAGGGTEAQLSQAQTNLTNAQNVMRQSQQQIASRGGLGNLKRMANNHQVPLTGKDYGTMAAGVGLAGLGGYAAFGGGNPAPPPQVAPHQYYMNQLGRYFG